MKLRLALLSLSAAASVAGVAYAEEPAAAAPAWYDQFTYNSGVAGGALGETDPKAAFDFVPSARWGVTLRMKDGEQPLLGQPPKGEETSVRAYYQFTPRLRVGGEVMVADGAKDDTREAASAPVARTPGEEPKARIRLESAFRF